MMVSDNWAPGRTVQIQGVIRNTRPKVAKDQPQRLLPLTYVKAIQVSFGDDRPSQAQLSKLREEECHDEDDQPEWREGPPIQDQE